METTFAISRKRILIIDDDIDLLEILKDLLVSYGLEVQVADQSDRVFQQIEQYKPDLVILDYLLKGINGGEICHQLKTAPNTKGIPVVIFSAFPKVLLSLGNYGCDLFIAKPFDVWEFLRQLNDLLVRNAIGPCSGFAVLEGNQATHNNQQISNQ